MNTFKVDPPRRDEVHQVEVGLVVAMPHLTAAAFWLGLCLIIAAVIVRWG